MLNRKQAYKSIKEYCWCFGYKLRVVPTSEKTENGRTLARFRILHKRKDENYNNLDFDDVVAFVRKYEPCALILGYESAPDIWEELKTIMEAEEREQDIRERKLLRKRKIQQFNAFIRDMEIALEKTEERRA